MVGFACPLACASDYGVLITAGLGVPLGDFGETDNIVEPTGLGSYNASGGGAESGYGFNLEFEVEVWPRLFAGGRFGYLRHDADAGDIIEQGLTPEEVTEIEAVWTWTALGVYGRAVVLETPALDLYGRFDMGASKMKNAFDVTLEIPEVGRSALSADFDLGNQFYFGGSIGGEYRISSSLAIVAQARVTHYLSDGAEASASVGEYTLTGTQQYSAQIMDITLGIRIPLSGI
jgi:hypothetical protein